MIQLFHNYYNRFVLNKKNEKKAIIKKFDLFCKIIVNIGMKHRHSFEYKYGTILNDSLITSTLDMSSLISCSEITMCKLI